MSAAKSGEHAHNLIPVPGFALLDPGYNSAIMNRIAVLDDYQNAASAMADWPSLAPECEATFFRDHLSDSTALIARLAPFQVVVAMRERTPFPRSLLERLPNLRLLVTTGMRNASIDLKAAAEHGVTVCGTQGLPYPTAELAWGLILALARRIPHEDAALRAGHWQTSIGLGLNGKTLGVIGLGTLGSRVARFGKAFEMEVLAWSQNLTPDRAAAVGATLVAKDELLRRADFVSLHLVLSDRTRGVIGAAELALMKRTAYLVNTSRAPLIDGDALLEALQKGTIAGAAIDVYEEEPVSAHHPLTKLPNMVLTPHLGYVTVETYRVFYGQAVEDIRAYLDAKPLRVLNAPN